MPRKRRAGALLAPALLCATLAGCGGNTDGTSTSKLTDDEQTAADNLAIQIVRSGSVSGQGSTENAVTEEQAACIGQGAVGDLGLDALQGYGILTEDLRVDKSIQGVRMSADHADAFADVLLECIDTEKLFEERFLGLLTGGSEPASQRLRGCVEDAVTAEPVRAVLSASFQGRSTKAYAELQKRVTACAEREGVEK